MEVEVTRDQKTAFHSEITDAISMFQRIPALICQTALAVSNTVSPLWYSHPRQRNIGGETHSFREHARAVIEIPDDCKSIFCMRYIM